jgi:TldD protein
MIQPSSATSRASLSEQLTSIREYLPQLIPLLETNPQWYGSIYLEQKTSKTYSVNLKQSQVSDQLTSGIVFRIYTGLTLFEEATDDLDHDRLKKFVIEFAKRVEKTEKSSGLEVRPYIPPPWKQRLAAALDPEITAQIPAGVDAKTSIHFGIRFKKDPFLPITQDHFRNLASLLDRCKYLAEHEGLPTSELTYLVCRQSIAKEESIFIDRETNLSQTLYRLALTVISMSGAERTFLRTGGLGGLETIEISDQELTQILRDLKSLKSAERLQPGKYRVLFGPEITGVLAHEAFGHSQEGDTCVRGRSKAWELHQSGEKVGNTQATILNNPALFENGGQSYGAWGSYFFDEEGWLAQEQVLLDQGKLLAPMTNLTSAIRLGVPRTANGKRESWASGVYTRQTNTYFSAGDQTLDALMSQLDDGYLALHPAGGMEDPKGMGIQVGISYLYEVKNGKKTGKIFKGPAGGDIQMTGYTPDVLNSIIGKSKIDYQSQEKDQSKFPHNDVGGCGKYHKEFVLAGCGGPYVLLDQVVLG